LICYSKKVNVHILYPIPPLVFSKYNFLIPFLNFYQQSKYILVISSMTYADKIKLLSAQNLLLKIWRQGFTRWIKMTWFCCNSVLNEASFIIILLTRRII